MIVKMKILRLVKGCIFLSSLLVLIVGACPDENKHEFVYKNLQSLFGKYRRSVTFLELGTCCGYYSFFSSLQYNLTSVIYEDNRWEEILKSCYQQDAKNIILLTQKFSIDNIINLIECEHFDVVYLNAALNPQYCDMSVLKRITRLGDNILIEVPCKHGSNASQLFKNCQEFLSDRTKTILFSDKSETSFDPIAIFFIEGQRKNLKKASWLKPIKDGVFEIVSDFNSKILIKTKRIKTKKPNGKLSIEKKQITTSWDRGINLITFKMLRGVYPSEEMLIPVILGSKKILHDDWSPHNMILQGKGIILIDNNDPCLKYRWEWPDGKLLILLKLKNPNSVKKYVGRLSTLPCAVKK